MTKVILNDTCNGGIYYLLLTKEQIRLLKWLEVNEFLSELEINYYNDEKFFEKI